MICVGIAVAVFSKADYINADISKKNRTNIILQYAHYTENYYLCTNMWHISVSSNMQ